MSQAPLVFRAATIATISDCALAGRQPIFEMAARRRRNAPAGRGRAQVSRPIVAAFARRGNRPAVRCRLAVLMAGWQARHCTEFQIWPKNDPGGTRTCSPRIRRPMPYPLGHGASYKVYLELNFAFLAETRLQ
jgi:hypothetical protein